MAEELSGKDGTLQQSYPDPASQQTTPYPVLLTPDPTRNGSADPGVDSTQRLAALGRFQLLASNLPGSGTSHSQDDTALMEASEAEGLPIPNRFLQVQPSSIDWPDESMAEETEDDLQSTANGASPAETPARGSTRGRGRGRGKRGWKWALKGTAHDPKLNRDPNTRPRGRPRGSGAGRGRKKKALDPGRDFKENQIKATRALLDGDFQRALEFARAAVQANPEIWAAHSLLAEALQSLGREEDSIAALLSGAVVARDAGTWMLVAERTLDFAGDARSNDILQQALFCYSQAIDLDTPSDRNLPARLAKLDIWIELGEYGKARRDCKALLGIIPGDIELARQLAELSAMTGDVYEMSLARKAYEIAMEATYTSAQGVDAEELEDAWNHLNILMELVDRVAPPTEAVTVLKRWARHFLGRGDEQYWEVYEDDDREFDNDDKRRSEAAQQQHPDPYKYGQGLPLELRVKLGLSRLKISSAHKAEALGHLSHLLDYSDEVSSLYEMFFQVATSLQDKNEINSAIQFYEPLLQIVDNVTDEFWLQYGRCLVSAARFEEGASCFERAIELNPSSIDGRVDLARVYQDELKDNEKAFRIVDEIIALNRKELLRRENLMVRPRTKQNGKRAREDSESSFSDSDHSEADAVDDLSADSPIGTRKRRRTKQAKNSSQLGEQGPSAAQNRKAEAEARRAAKKALHTQQQTESIQMRIEARRARRDARIRSRMMMESMADQLVQTFEIVKRLWPAMELGDEAAVEEWTEAAMSMYEAFRGVKQFYPTRDKHVKFRGFERMEAGEARFMNEMESWRRELESQQAGRSGPTDKDFMETFQAPPAPDESLPKDFCGISFTDWHHIFVDLALLHARRAAQLACYEVIDDGLYGANVFYHDPVLLNTTQATSLSCAFIFNDSERLCFAARWFINRAEFRQGSGFQLLSAANRLSYGGNMWFSAGPTQKHMLRVVKALDYHAFDSETRKRFDWSMQGPGLKNRVQRIGEPVGHLDANALLTYGHMVGVANHSHSALPYFFRAFALQPENATVILSIAVMYVQNAMKRQTDNRHYGVMQGISFLHRYQDVRGASPLASIQQEVAYNTGRLWHMLGLTHLAVTSYEKAIGLSDEVQQEFAALNPDADYAAEDFSREAALALVDILALSGNDHAAERIAEQHLVL